MFLVVFATLVIIVVFTFATVKDGGQASAVDVVILKIAINSGIISAVRCFYGFYGLWFHGFMVHGFMVSWFWHTFEGPHFFSSSLLRIYSEL